jgi:hypothetical protein
MLRFRMVPLQCTTVFPPYEPNERPSASCNFRLGSLYNINVYPTTSRFTSCLVEKTSHSGSRIISQATVRVSSSGSHQGFNRCKQPLPSVGRHSIPDSELKGDHGCYSAGELVSEVSEALNGELSALERFRAAAQQAIAEQKFSSKRRAPKSEALKEAMPEIRALRIANASLPAIRKMLKDSDVVDVSLKTLRKIMRELGLETTEPGRLTNDGTTRQPLSDKAGKSQGKPSSTNGVTSKVTRRNIAQEATPRQSRKQANGTTRERQRGTTADSAAHVGEPTTATLTDNGANTHTLTDTRNDNGSLKGNQENTLRAIDHSTEREPKAESLTAQRSARGVHLGSEPGTAPGVVTGSEGGPQGGTLPLPQVIPTPEPSAATDAGISRKKRRFGAKGIEF